MEGGRMLERRPALQYTQEDSKATKEAGAGAHHKRRPQLSSSTAERRRQLEGHPQQIKEVAPTENTKRPQARERDQR
jgi:hypothetical protein